MTFRSIALCMVSFGTMTVSAQKTHIIGRVLDSQSAEPLVRATVQLLKADTTSLVTGAVTTNVGGFDVKNVTPGNYVAKVSYVGYHNFFRSVSVDAKTGEMNLGTVMLVPSSVMLQAATVTGVMKQMEVKEDTLIFNADAFKVPEGSVLEDLIRKLPGAEVGTDGTVKINGKTVNKILVEGKEFFGNDKSMSMKNLPSEIVDKVKSYDKQSERARLTGVDDGEEETVIDLTIKKGMKKGWFGHLDAAGGTKDRYSGRAMLNRFAEGTQVSLITNYNNVGDRGMGGGRGGNGDNKTGQGGVNIALERGKVQVGGNVRGNLQNSKAISKSSVQNLDAASLSYSNSYNRTWNRNHNMNANFRIEWKLDSMTTLVARPDFSWGKSKSSNSGHSATFNSDPYDESSATEGAVIENPLDQMDLISDRIKVNNNVSGSASRSSDYSAGGNVVFNRRLSDTGRNLSFNASGSYSNSTSRSFNLSDVTYFQRNDSMALTYRYQTTPGNSTNYSFGFSYTEPLVAKKLFLTLDYSYRYSKRHSDGQAYDMGDVELLLDSIRAAGVGFLPENYRDYLDRDLSRYTDNWNMTHNINLQARLITGGWNMNVGVNIQPQHQKVKYQYMNVDTVASRSFIRVSPTLNLRYAFSKRNVLRVRYRANTQQPNMTDLFAMTNTSNPLNIRLGNPDLKPSFTQNLSVEWNDYVAATMQNFNAQASFRTTANSISSRTEYNPESGGRITQPVNINGDWGANGRFGFNTPLFTEWIYLNTSTSVSYANNVGYIYQSHDTYKNVVKNLGLGERLSLSVRRTYWDVSVNGSVNFSHVRSKYVASNNRNTYDFSYGMAANMNLDNGFAASTNLSVDCRRGYPSSTMNTNELIWNAQVSYRFLQGRRATISLQAYDILNQRSNVSRSISATRLSDTWNNSVHSYLMAHLIYRFNMFGTPQARREMRERRNGYM